MKKLTLVVLFLFAISLSYGQTKSRSAKSGQYVTKDYASKHKSTTVNESSKSRSKGTSTPKTSSTRSKK